MFIRQLTRDVARELCHQAVSMGIPDRSHRLIRRSAASVRRRPGGWRRLPPRAGCAVWSAGCCRSTGRSARSTHLIAGARTTHASPRAGGNRRAVVAGPRSSSSGFAVAHSKPGGLTLDRCTTSRKPRVALSIKRQQSATCGTAGAGRTKAWPEPPRSLAIISTSG